MGFENHALITRQECKLSIVAWYCLVMGGMKYLPKHVSYNTGREKMQ